MATRSYIGVRNLDASVDYIYCHFDGYPSHHGEILTEHYKTPAKVKALMELGDISVLGPEIGGKHDFNGETPSNWCRAYGRDRNEPNTSAKNSGYNELINDVNVDYVYIFDGDYWKCFDTYNSEEVINLYKTQSTQS